MLGLNKGPLHSALLLCWYPAPRLEKITWRKTSRLENVINCVFPNQAILGTFPRLAISGCALLFLADCPAFSRTSISRPPSAMWDRKLLSNQSWYLVPEALFLSTCAYFPSNYVLLPGIDGYQHQFDFLLTYRCSDYLHNLWLTVILLPSNGTWQVKEQIPWCNKYHLGRIFTTVLAVDPFFCLKVDERK